MTRNRPTWSYLLDVYDACSGGRQALEAVVGDLNAPMPCSWAWALAVLSSPGLPAARYVGWGVGRLVDRADVGVVAGADFCGADLRGADLCHADLRGAYLRGADLRGADLTGADLRHADLRGAYLTDADLRGADLTGVGLQDADLTGARRDPSDPAIPWWITAIDANGRVLATRANAPPDLDVRALAFWRASL